MNIEKIKQFAPDEIRGDKVAYMTAEIIAAHKQFITKVEPGEITVKDPRLSWDELHETVCQVIETFEDFLNDRGIAINNPEKNDSTGNPKSNIYGTDYGELQSHLELIFVDRGLVTQEIIDKFK